MLDLFLRIDRYMLDLGDRVVRLFVRRTNRTMEV